MLFCQWTLSGLTGPTGRNVARSVVREEEFRSDGDPALTRHLCLSVGGSVKERVLNHVNATIFLVSTK